MHPMLEPFYGPKERFNATKMDGKLMQKCGNMKFHRENGWETDAKMREHEVSS